VASSERLWSEQKWYALTGRVVELRAEEDGDLHIALKDATGDKLGIVLVARPDVSQGVQGATLEGASRLLDWQRIRGMEAGRLREAVGRDREEENHRHARHASGVHSPA
jgi:hypothetical protein